MLLHLRRRAFGFARADRIHHLPVLRIVSFDRGAIEREATGLGLVTRLNESGRTVIDAQRRVKDGADD